MAIAVLPLLAANVWFIAQFASFAEQRSADIRGFARTVAPPGLRDGELAVDIELPAQLVQREVGVKIANIPFADEYAGMWVPMRSGPVTPPRWYLARAKLFGDTGTLRTIHGTYRIERRSPDGVLCLARLETSAR
jgi:hypothetical protein